MIYLTPPPFFICSSYISTTIFQLHEGGIVWIRNFAKFQFDSILLKFCYHNIFLLASRETVPLNPLNFNFYFLLSCKSITLYHILATFCNVSQNLHGRKIKVECCVTAPKKRMQVRCTESSAAKYSSTKEQATNFQTLSILYLCLCNTVSISSPLK
jgi:hypothetical protein